MGLMNEIVWRSALVTSKRCFQQLAVVLGSHTLLAAEGGKGLFCPLGRT